VLIIQLTDLCFPVGDYSDHIPASRVPFNIRACKMFCRIHDAEIICIHKLQCASKITQASQYDKLTRRCPKERVAGFLLKSFWIIKIQYTEFLNLCFKDYERHMKINNGIFWMLRSMALVRTDVSEELSASLIRVTRIGELGTTLAVTSNWPAINSRIFVWSVGSVRYKGFFLCSMRQLLVTASVVPGSPILVILMKGTLGSSET
jgi:hypothetical protein